MKNIEYEYKLIITHDNYTELLTYLKLKFEYKTYVQFNTYFDTLDKKLKEHNSAFRIRLLNNTWEWTFKQKISKYKKLELKQLTLSSEFESITDPIKSKLLTLVSDFSNLKPLCIIETQRTDFKYFSSTLSLDYSKYNENANNFDYELELEIFNDKDLAEFKLLTKRFNIKMQQANNKITRALQFKNKKF